MGFFRGHFYFKSGLLAIFIWVFWPIFLNFFTKPKNNLTKVRFWPQKWAENYLNFLPVFASIFSTNIPKTIHTSMKAINTPIPPTKPILKISNIEIILFILSKCIQHMSLPILFACIHYFAPPFMYLLSLNVFLFFSALAIARSIPALDFR